MGQSAARSTLFMHLGWAAERIEKPSIKLSEYSSLTLCSHLYPCFELNMRHKKEDQTKMKLLTFSWQKELLDSWSCRIQNRQSWIPLDPLKRGHFLPWIYAEHTTPGCVMQFLQLGFKCSLSSSKDSQTWIQTRIKHMKQKIYALQKLKTDSKGVTPFSKTSAVGYLVRLSGGVHLGGLSLSRAAEAGTTSKQHGHDFQQSPWNKALRQLPGRTSW